MNWRPKDWRAMAALLFSVIGAGVLTAVGGWLAYLLVTGRWTVATEASRADSVGWVAIIAMTGVVLVLLGLGMAINRRSLAARWGDRSLDYTGGDEAPAAAAKVSAEVAQAGAEAAKDKAAEIAAEAVE